MSREAEHLKKTKGKTEAVVRSIDGEVQDDVINQILKELKSMKVQINQVSSGKDIQGEEKSVVTQILNGMKQMQLQINQISTGKDEQVAWLTSEMQDVRKTLKTLERHITGVDKPVNRGNKVQFIRCEKCEETNKFCKHCAECGEIGHKRAECPKNE